MGGFILRSVRQDNCASDLDIIGIIDQADEKLFQVVLANPNHVLSSLLPDKTYHHYYLRARLHDRQLANPANYMFNPFYASCSKLLLFEGTSAILV